MHPSAMRASSMATRLGRFAPRASPALISSSVSTSTRPLLRQNAAPRLALAAASPRRTLHSSPSLLQSSGSSATERPAILPEFSLKGKVIVVSGGGRGVGLVQSEALLEAGAIVHVFDRLPPPTADSDFSKVAARARDELGTELYYHNVDVRDSKALNEIVGALAEKHGRLDGLIAAAGVQQETPALEYTAEDCDRLLGINITGVFMTAQAVAREMVKRKQKGSLVLIGSMSGTVANRGLICPAYNASKAGVLQLARNLASEWGEYGIRVNTISPGYIVTAMTATLFDAFPERKTSWPNANMLGRLSYPEEYRGAAVFLLSDASSFMTGADLRMDGGHAAW